jgi:hypothetical protein
LHLQLDSTILIAVRGRKLIALVDSRGDCPPEARIAGQGAFYSLIVQTPCTSRAGSFAQLVQTAKEVGTHRFSFRKFLLRGILRLRQQAPDYGK